MRGYWLTSAPMRYRFTGTVWGGQGFWLLPVASPPAVVGRTEFPTPASHAVPAYSPSSGRYSWSLRRRQVEGASAPSFLTLASDGAGVAVW